jgi:hypothetical protein
MFIEAAIFWFININNSEIELLSAVPGNESRTMVFISNAEGTFVLHLSGTV